MPSRGFTLVELLLSISLSGIAVLLGALMWRQSLASATHLAEHRARLDRTSGSRRWLETMIGSIDVGAVGDRPFTGHQASAQFTAWIPGSAGWPERQAVSLGVAGQQFQADLGASGSLALMDSVASVGFDYLLEPGLNTTWASTWESPVSAPLAIRVRLMNLGGTADTILVLVGPRG